MAVAMTDPLEALRRIPLFQSVGPRELRSLASSLRDRTVPPGKELTLEGKGGIGFFVISEGEAEVSIGGESRGTLGPGDYFGEMALIDGDTRSATVVAKTDLRCFGMTAWEFGPFVRTHPDVAWEIMRTLVQRLRQAAASDSPSTSPNDS